jgi:hypothetical protein
MEKPQTAFFSPRVVAAIPLWFVGCFLAVLSFAGTADTGASTNTSTTASIPQSGSRTATYQGGGFTFGLTKQLLPNALPVGQYQNVEPEIKIDIFGNIYVTAIQGVPDGLDLWKSADKGANFTYLGQPDGVQCPTPPTCVDEVGAGGADDSIDVNSGGQLYITSLWFGSLSFARSTNGGFAPWNQNQVASSVPSVDRQWIAAYGPSTVYLTYRQLLLVGANETNVIFVQKSTDGGKTFGLPIAAYPTDSPVLAQWQGNLVVDQYNGNLYTVFRPQEENGHTRAELWLLRSTDGGATWALSQVYQGATGKDAANVWPVMAVDRAGNVHLAFSECDHDGSGVNSHCVIKLMSSNDGGATWLDPVQVNNGQETRYAVEPWMVAGGNGIVDLVWYGADIDSSTQQAPWHVFFAQTRDALSSSPTFNQVQAVSQVVHTRDICLDGLSCTGDRHLAEYFTVTLDPEGNANIAFTDDVNNTSSFDGGQGRTWYTRQISGSAAYWPTAIGTVPATFAPSIPIPSSDGRNEPNVKVDSHNCIFASAINGLSSAVARSTDGGASFGPMNPLGFGFAGHGADCDILTVPKSDGSRPDYVYSADLGSASVHVGKSTDGGINFVAAGTDGTAGEANASTDRMWYAWDRNVPTLGDQTLYLMDHEFTTEYIRFAALTNDGTWSPAVNAITDPALLAPPDSTIPNTYPGPVFVSPITHMVYGLFAASHVVTNAEAPPFGKTPDAWEVVGPPPAAAGLAPGPFTNYPVWMGLLDSPATAPASAITYGNAIANLWPAGAIDTAGNIYAVWATNSARVNATETGTTSPSTTFDIWFSASHDGGKNFYGPWKVSSGVGTSVFPWVAAGDAGRVDIVWYQSNSVGPPLVADPTNPGTLTGGSNNMPTGSTWNVMFAQSLNATSREPAFAISQASDHVMHTGSISTGGLTGIFNDRSLGDFFEVAIGPDGLANIAFTDTSVSPNVIAYTRQTSGPIALTNPRSVTCMHIDPPFGAVSRKTHGSAGTFDVNLPLTGDPGIECRSGGANGDHAVVITFAGPVTFASAMVCSGTGIVAGTSTNSNGNEITVNLTGVTNAQTINICLTNVSDGTSTGNVTIPMGVLLADVNANGVLTNADVSLVKAQVAAGGSVGLSNFRDDVNANGVITNADVSVTKAQVAAGAQLP